MKFLYWAVPALLCLSAILGGCKKDVFNQDGILEFSEDTVLFDTVFTTIGSATRQFKIYNRHDKEINISSIILAGGQTSKYRLNVDGDPGIAFSNIRVPARDSLFVFVDVTLDPNNLAQPAIITDSVLFNTNGVIQDVDLAAFGWDADFYYPTDFIENIGSISFLDCDVTWTSIEPRVLYGWVVVPENCTLTIEEGTHVYSHKYSGIIVDENATLIVNGTSINPVVFASDRLDEFYEDQAGEWNGIWLFNGSKDNVINHALIKNGNFGVRVDTVNTSSIEPTLIIKNTIIENMSSVSLLAYTAKINAYNCVFGNAGQHSAAMIAGGEYNFYHCTFGNYWVHGNRQTPAVFMTNWLETSLNYYLEPLQAYFGNCIVYGNNQSEIGLDEDPAAAFDFEFDNCLARVDADEVDVTDLSEFHGMLFNQDPKFVDPSEQNFELDTLSPAMNAGNISITNVDFGILGTDAIGNVRPNGPAPDLGAYERQE